MTVFIPLKKAYDDNIELRYALRSFVYCFCVDRLIVVGYCPPWLQCAEFIPFEDLPQAVNKEENIYLKTIEAFEVAESFVFANDDHFISADFNPLCNYFDTNIIEKVKDEKPLPGYQITLSNTVKLVGHCKYFDIHCPIIYERDKFPKYLHFPPYGYCIKSVYGHLNKIAGTQADDLKLKRKYANYRGLYNKLFFSSSEGCFHPLFFEYLQNRWPEPSKFEKY
jgi:hypothetical protein